MKYFQHLKRNFASLRSHVISSIYPDLSGVHTPGKHIGGGGGPTYFFGFKIAQFRYINTQLQTIDFSTRLWGINYRVCGVYSLKPCGDVYCFKLNFKISKLAYLHPLYIFGPGDLSRIFLGLKVCLIE